MKTASSVRMEENEGQCQVAVEWKNIAEKEEKLGAIGPIL